MPTHQDRMRWIDENVPENFRALVRDLMVDCLAPYVLALPDKETRRAYIEDIPVDCDPPWARSLIECRVRELWKQRKRGS
jgi:hypothetical protein